MFVRGRPEDPHHTQVAVRALINAGYAPHEAGRAFLRYRTHVREATAGWPAILFAGFIVGALPGLVFLFTGAPPAAGLLCAGGIGLAVIERWRWRRALVHRQFTIQSPDQHYLLHQGLLWVALLVVLAAFQWAQAGAVIGLGIAMGLPLSFVFRYYFYRSYPTSLAIVSHSPAGANARSIIEQEIAAEHSSGGQDANTERLQQTLTRQRSKTGVNARFRMRLAVFLAGLAGWWFLVRWYVWWESGATSVESLVPFSGDIGVDILGIFGGALIGVGVVWGYRRYIEA